MLGGSSSLVLPLLSNIPFLLTISFLLCMLSFLLPLSFSSSFELTTHLSFSACFPLFVPHGKMPYHGEEDDEQDEAEQQQQREEGEEEEEDGEEEEDEEEEERRHRRHLEAGASDPTMICLSCKETYTRRSSGTCRECYEEASETEEELKREIEELKSRICFLKTWAPEAMGEGCTDIVLETSDGSKIRAHNAVLVSRSSVFKAMLENEMEESRSGTIKITDFSYEVLKIFVHYLYTAEVYPELLDECAYDLLALAEKYNVKHLKSVCEKFMTSKMNTQNALFSFEYANQHGAKILKEAALSIIIENIHELTVQDDYRNLVNRDAKLVVEIYEAYLIKQANSNSL